jgi:hypothetical protein
MRTVRLVTNVAKHALRMRHRIHLGKSLGLSSVFLMAASAEVGYVRQFGDIGDGVVRVFGQGAVAGLAGDTRVLSPVMHLGLLIVAEAAFGSARIGNGVRVDHVERTHTIVSIFSKVLGHHGGANN